MKLLQLLQVVVELNVRIILVQFLLFVLQHQLPVVSKRSQVVVCAAGDKA
jgi:hypothetical protein